MPNQNSSWNRRSFLKSGAAAGAGTLLLRASSQAKVIGANDRIRFGAIGTGGRGQWLLRVLNGRPNQELVALCDSYRPNLLRATQWAIPGADTYGDYRRILDRPDIDAVIIATPNHHHKEMLLAAVAAGKDVYCEKPMTHTIEEGPEIVKAVQASKQVVQTGTQQRSWPHWLLAGDLIRSGHLGQITMVETYWYQSYGWQPSTGPSDFDVSQLDTAAWLGNAPAQTVTAEKFHFWRWFWDFGGGSPTDLMTHWMDMVQAYLGQITPEVFDTFGHNALHPQWQCPDVVNASMLFPGNILATFNCTMCSSIDDGGAIIRGTKATLKIDRERLAVYPEGLRHAPHSNAPDPELTMVSERDGTIDHMQNFLDCIRSRKQPNANVEVGMQAARTSHLCNIAFRRGKRIVWDSTRNAVAS